MREYVSEEMLAETIEREHRVGVRGERNDRLRVRMARDEQEYDGGCERSGGERRPHGGGDASGATQRRGVGKRD